jgi:MFS family permease
MKFFRNSIKIPIKMEKLGIVLFLNALAYALIGSILAIYVNTFVNNDSMVGFIFTGLIVLSIICHLLITPIIESTSKVKMYLYSSILIGICYGLYILVQNVLLFFVIATLITIFNTLKLTAGGLLVEHVSDKKNLAKNEGITYTIYDLAWIIGPLLVGFILEKFGFDIIFLLSMFFMFASAFTLRMFKLNYSGKMKHSDGHNLKNIIGFFGNKNRFKNYLLSAGITFWWSLVFVYMPLLIIKSLAYYWVGFFLFATMIPLIFFTYYFGSVASKKGYKKLFVIGFFIPALIAFLCFIFFDSIWFVMGIFILSSIGLSMTEGTTESYFFDTLKAKEDQKFYAPYNTALDVGSLGGEFIPALILLFLPFKFIFLFFAAGMFILSIISLTMKEVIESRRKGKFK